MIKDAIKKGIRTGLVTGLVFIFLILIGFIFAGSNMIGDLLGNSTALSEQGRMPLNNLIILISLMGLIAGVAAGKTEGSGKWPHLTVQGASTGLSLGLLVGAVIGLLGGLHMAGVGFRTYLPNLSPERINFLLFYSTPLAAARTYLMYLFIFSLVGVLLRKLFTMASKLKSVFQNLVQGAQDVISSKGFGHVISSKAVLVLLVILGAALLYTLPLFWGSYWNYIMGTVAVYILLGLGLNIIVGYSGQLVLGYVAFFAVGAYTFALLTAPDPHGIGLNLWLALGM